MPKSTIQQSLTDQDKAEIVSKLDAMVSSYRFLSHRICEQTDLWPASAYREIFFYLNAIMACLVDPNAPKCFFTMQIRKMEHLGKVPCIDALLTKLVDVQWLITDIQNKVHAFIDYDYPLAYYATLVDHTQEVIDQFSWLLDNIQTTIKSTRAQRGNLENIGLPSL